MLKKSLTRHVNAYIVLITATRRFIVSKALSERYVYTSDHDTLCIALICCLTEEIVDDPQNLSHHYVKSHELCENSSEIGRYRSNYVSEHQTLTIQLRLAQMRNKLTLLLYINMKKYVKI